MSTPQTQQGDASSCAAQPAQPVQSNTPRTDVDARFLAKALVEATCNNIDSMGSLVVTTLNAILGTNRRMCFRRAPAGMSPWRENGVITRVRWNVNTRAIEWMTLRDGKTEEYTIMAWGRAANERYIEYNGKAAKSTNILLWAEIIIADTYVRCRYLLPSSIDGANLRRNNSETAKALEEWLFNRYRPARCQDHEKFKREMDFGRITFPRAKPQKTKHVYDRHKGCMVGIHVARRLAEEGLSMLSDRHVAKGTKRKRNPDDCSAEEPRVPPHVRHGPQDVASTNAAAAAAAAAAVAAAASEQPRTPTPSSPQMMSLSGEPRNHLLSTFNLDPDMPVHMPPHCDMLVSTQEARFPSMQVGFSQPPSRDLNFGECMDVTRVHNLSLDAHNPLGNGSDDLFDLFDNAPSSSGI